MKTRTKRTVRYVFVFAVVLVLAAGITAGSAAADHRELSTIDGNGTEDDPYVITDVHELQAINQDLEAQYVLGNDIDASETEAWEAGAGFTPIGDEDDWFSGSLDGRDHTIEGLHIDRPGTAQVGLFGYTRDSTIENVRLEDASITGGAESSAFVAFNSGDIHDVTVSGRIRGTGERLGGLVGYNSGEITGSSFVGTVDGTGDNVGGLAGSNSGPIDFSYTVVTIEGNEGVGGLVGSNTGPIRASFAAGNVTGESGIGGLIGYNSDALNDVYSSASVSGNGAMGGLVGSNSGTITSAYTIGTVTGSDISGGVMASNSGIVNTVYWNVQTSGQSEAYSDDNSDESDVIGLESDELTGDSATETTEFDFDSVWDATDEYPRLQWETDRDVPEEAYDVVTEPVDLEEETETEAESESEETTDAEQERDANEVLGVSGFGVMPAALALLAVVALIGYRKRS